MSAKKLTTPTTTDNSLSPWTEWYGNSIFCLAFKRSYLKKNKNATYTPDNRTIFFIAYELDTLPQDLNSDFTLKECLFGGDELAKMLIQIKMYVVVMVLDSIRVQNFPYLMVV